VTSQTEQEDLTSHIRRQRAAVFGHVRRLPEEARSDGYMRLAVDTRAGGRPDNNSHWKRRPGRPRHTWVDKWRSTPVSPLMLHGTLPSTAAVGGRYDTPAGQARLMMNLMMMMLLHQTLAVRHYLTLHGLVVCSLFDCRSMFSCKYGVQIKLCENVRNCNNAGLVISLKL